MWSELGAALAEDWRRRWRRYLIEGVVFAGLVVAFAYVSRRSESPRDPRYLFHTMMADLCKDESDLMRSRAARCRDWGARGIAPDLRGEEAETLRICPYPWDLPRVPSWAEQAGVWDRAAEKSAKAASRHEHVVFWLMR